VYSLPSISMTGSEPPVPPILISSACEMVEATAPDTKNAAVISRNKLLFSHVVAVLIMFPNAGTWPLLGRLVVSMLILPKTQREMMT
jgi:hypothetical protein